MKQPLNLSLTIYQGQTFDDTLSLQNEDGTVIDLTGYTAQMQARNDITDVLPVLTWTTETGEIVIDGAAGKISFNVTAEATYDLPTNNDLTQWVYDMRIINGAEPPYAERVIQGVLVIIPAVTRPLMG